MLTGIELIADERQEQIEDHGRTIEHDVQHNQNFQLSEAAGMLTILDPNDLPHIIAPTGWDEWHFKCMMDKPYEDRLVIAGALLAAELDRLQNK